MYRLILYETVWSILRNHVKENWYYVSTFISKELIHLLLLKFKLEVSKKPNCEKMSKPKMDVKLFIAECIKT